jgi:hypothetical protein
VEEQVEPKEKVKGTDKEEVAANVKFHANTFQSTMILRTKCKSKWKQKRERERHRQRGSDSDAEVPCEYIAIDVELGEEM